MSLQNSKRTAGDKTWRKKVLERDNNTCQTCGVQEESILTAHHLMPKRQYPELRYEVDNGVTLCRDCHDFEEHDLLHKSRFISRVLMDNRFNRALIRSMLKTWNEINPYDISDKEYAVMGFIEDTLRCVGYMLVVDEDSCNMTIAGRDYQSPDMTP